MGSITRFDLTTLIREHGLKAFIETGTGTGASIQHARGFPFDIIGTCECEHDLARDAMRNFRHDSRIEVFQQDSVTFLHMACRLMNQSYPILFWLDAHFPGADYGLRTYAAEEDADRRLPMERELEQIITWRRRNRDVIICDDLRIYEDGPYAHGNLPTDLRHLCPADRNIDFVFQLMGQTHHIERLYEHEGYLLMTPKG